MRGRNHVSVILFMAVFVLSASALAQVKVASNSLDRASLKLPPQNTVPQQLLNPISIDLNNVPLGRALQVISEKGNFQLLFSETFIPTGRIVSVSLDNATAAEALNQVLAQTATEYAVTSAGQVVLVPTKYTRNNQSGLPQQVPQINGIVVDEKTSEPLAGANVFIKGATVGAAADRNGQFSFGYDGVNEFTLVASFVGYKQFEKIFSPSDNLSNLRIALTLDAFLSEEIVVTGIASRRSKAVAEVSVARIAAQELSEKQVYTTFNQLMAGKVSGVQLTQNSGTLGSGYRFFVRGGGGLNGSGQPLIFIDGARADNSQINLFFNSGQTVSNMATLNPNEIESIEMLKGPAAAAMYGTDASNGVVLITTKTGKLKPGSPSSVSVNYKLDFGSSEPAFKYDPDKYFNADIMNNDLLRSGTFTSNNFDISGGNNFMRYFASFEKKNQEGITANNFHDRSSGRLNLTAFPNDKLTLRLSTSYSQNNLTRPLSDDAVLGYNWAVLMFDEPFELYDKSAILSTVSQVWNNRFMASGQMTWKPINNVEIFGSFGVDRTDYREDETYPQGERYWLGTIGRRIIATTRPINYSSDFNARYSYSPAEDLEISSVVGAQLFEREVTGTFQQRRNFSSPLIMNIQAGATLTSSNENKFNARTAGIYTSHTLSYQDKYFATLGLRKDYASAIGQQAPSIIYPQASFALRLDKFGFLPSSINLLKFRAAYGESGQLPNIEASQRLLWTAGGGNAYGTGAVISSAGDIGIEPERVKEFEIGLDTELFSKYSIETTYYRTFVSNSILGVPSSPSSGLGGINRPSNIGKVEGQGLEFLFQANPVRTRNYDLGMSFIWNWQKNEVTDLSGLGPLVAPYAVSVDAVGLARHQFFAFQNPGATFDENGVYAGPQAAVRTDLGSPIPSQTGSFTLNFRFLKNFSLYGLADWARGNRVFSILRAFAASRGGYKPYFEMAARLGLRDLVDGNTQINYDDYTQLTPGTPEYTALAHQFARQNPSNRGNHIYDADFFVLREISLSYDFTDLLRRSNITSNLKGLRSGFSIRNVARFSKYKDGDFEVNAAGGSDGTWGVDYGTLPQARVYNFFLQVSI